MLMRFLPQIGFLASDAGELINCVIADALIMIMRDSAREAKSAAMQRNSHWVAGNGACVGDA
jgi:hypothetical protein